MTKSVTKDQYKQAIVNSTVLQPFEFYLSRLDAATISDDVEVQQKITEMKAIINDLHSQHKAVIEKGQEQHENRPADLINQAATRINIIPALIGKEQKAISHKLKSREIKVLELQKKHFDQAEIDQICPPISQEEIDAANDKVRALQHESEVLLRFVGNSPEFNIEILRGTAFYPEPEIA
jgi:hypothetical protein